MSTPAISPLATTPAPASTTAALNKLADPNMFLQLLIAQLKYQNPDSPADGTQFVTQLATFSQVGQSTQMVSDLDSIRALLAAQAVSNDASADKGAASSKTSTTSPATNSK